MQTCIKSYSVYSQFQFISIRIHKNANIANSVYYGKTRLMNGLHCLRVVLVNRELGEGSVNWPPVRRHNLGQYPEIAIVFEEKNEY